MTKGRERRRIGGSCWGRGRRRKCRKNEILVIAERGKGR